MHVHTWKSTKTLVVDTGKMSIPDIYSALLEYYSAMFSSYS